MNTTKHLIEKCISQQKEMLQSDLGNVEKHSINYCILVLEDLLKEIDQSYEGEDGNLHKKDW